MRLTAAASVIFSHSFLIAEGSEANEPMVRYFGGTILGSYGVFAFFIISGFLVTLSAKRSRTVWRYALKRFLRIYPGLICCLLLTSIVIGATFTSWTPQRYLTSSVWLKYTLETLTLWTQGVWLDTLHFYPGEHGEELNGALWTIQQEISCYVVVGILQAFGWLRLRVATALLAALLATQLFPLLPDKTPEGITNFCYTAPCFFAGAAIALKWPDGPLPKEPLVLSVLIMSVGIALGRSSELFALSGSYPLLWLARNDRFQLPNLRPFGDISYGTYLYGWPVQQVWRVVLGHELAWWRLFLLSLPTAALAGYASWHIVEKRFLALKPKSGRGPTEGVLSEVPKVETTPW